MTFTKMHNGTTFSSLTEIILSEVKGNSVYTRSAGSGTFLKSKPRFLLTWHQLKKMLNNFIIFI